jgi:hypothetical protein
MSLVTSPVEPDYTVNPARLVEKYAVEVIRSWVGDRGVVRDESAGGGPDLWIDYGDGRRAVGEVKTDVDPVIQAMWAGTFRRPRHQVIELSPGAGRWSVRLTRGASIKRLYAELPAVVDSLLATGRIHVDTGWLAPGDDLGQRVARLGIEYVAQASPADDGGSLAIYFMPTRDATSPLCADPETVVEWVDGLLATDKYRKVAASLSLIEGLDERHLFIMSESATGAPADRALQSLDKAPPQLRPRLPDGITHLWAASRWQASGRPSMVALWTEPDGWTAVPG